MNQTVYAEKLVAQYGIFATSNIPGSPGVDLVPRRMASRGVMMSFPSIDPYLVA